MRSEVRGVHAPANWGVRMRKPYQVLAYAIAVLVVVRAGTIAWGFFGTFDWITEEGGVVNKAYLESEGGDIRFPPSGASRSTCSSTARC